MNMIYDGDTGGMMMMNPGGYYNLAGGHHRRFGDPNVAGIIITHR